VAWYFTHLDDVLSDMSVFHRVDDIDAVDVSVFLPRMARLAIYDGAVRFALARRPVAPAPRSVAPITAAPAEPAKHVTPHSAAQLQAMNQSREYGPLGVNQAGVFQIG
jgi:hypothetical protein